MIRREIQSKLSDFHKYYPVITVTGPRQSGKTTLVKSTFKDLPYISLETLTVRNRAIEDPLLFLKNFPKGAVLDEVQKAPELFSYIQDIVDNNDKIRFVLTGSQNFLMLENISQSLAGRTAIVKLLPFSMKEIKNTLFEIDDVYEYIYQGSYPRLYDKKIPASRYYSDYIATYIERDVRSIKYIENLTTFNLFIKLCAGRVGQLLNINSLASDTGITFNTAKKWLSVLKTSYILYTVEPYHKNYKKRLVKSSKLFFYDTGIVCNLLNIRSAKQLETHYMRGNIFENFIINELIKNGLNQGENTNLYFWRDNHGKEIGCIIEQAEKILAIEIKSGMTYNSDFFKNIIHWNKISKTAVENNYVVYGGADSFQTKHGSLIRWKDIGDIPI